MRVRLARVADGLHTAIQVVIDAGGHPAGVGLFVDAEAAGAWLRRHRPAWQLVGQEKAATLADPLSARIAAD